MLSLKIYEKMESKTKEVAQMKSRKILNLKKQKILGNNEIARKLGVARRTVRMHTYNKSATCKICRKKGGNND